MLTRVRSLVRRIPFPDLGKLLPKGIHAKVDPKVTYFVAGSCVVVTAILVFVHRFPLHVYRAQNDSMAPAFYRGDLFGVERFSTWFGSPDRYDLVSYRYPLDPSKRLVHRVVGLPGEKVRIEKGDIWVRPDGGRWRVLHKPDGVQSHMWKAVLPETTSIWFAADELTSWNMEGNRLEADGPGAARWGMPGTSVHDAYEHGHSEGRRADLETPPDLEENVVGDLRLSGWVRAAEGCTEAWIELHEGRKVYRFSIPGPAAEHGAAPAIRVGKAEQLAQPYALPANQEVAFRVANIDDRLVFELDEVEIATLDVDSVNPSSNEVRVCFAGGGGVWQDMLLERDVYYVSPPGEKFNVTVPEGHYLLLGDNPQHFMDPRFWRALKLVVRTDDGKETYVGDLRPTENPRTWVEDGETWMQFRDREGDRHAFRRDDLKKRSYEPSPFVPREMIEGSVLWGAY